MTRSNVGVVPLLAGLLSLGGCGFMHHGQGHEQRMGERLHREPLVFVKAGLVSVSPEPVVLSTVAGDKDITWRLPPGTRFDGAGVVVVGRVRDSKNNPLRPEQKSLEETGTRVDDSGKSAFVCRVHADQQLATCTPQGKAAPPGVYKYLITVVHQGKTLSWDPNILHLD